MTRVPLDIVDCPDRRITRAAQDEELFQSLLDLISDNGAAGEDMAELINKLAPTAKDWFDKTFDNRPENWGQPRSCMDYGPAWAQVSSVPFRLFKGVEAEGGIRAPLIVCRELVSTAEAYDRIGTEGWSEIVRVGATWAEPAG